MEVKLCNSRVVLLLLLTIVLFCCVGISGFGQFLVTNGDGHCSLVRYVNYTECGRVRYPFAVSCAQVSRVSSNATMNPCNYRPTISYCVPGVNISTIDMTDYVDNAESPYADCLHDSTTNKACCTWNGISCAPSCGGPDDVHYGYGYFSGYILPTPQQKYCFSSCTSCLGLQKTQEWCAANCGSGPSSTIYCQDQQTNDCCDVDNSSSTTLSSWLSFFLF